MARKRQLTIEAGPSIITLKSISLSLRESAKKCDGLFCWIHSQYTVFCSAMQYHLVYTQLVWDSFYRKIITQKIPPSYVRTTLGEKKIVASTVVKEHLSVKKGLCFLCLALQIKSDIHKTVSFLKHSSSHLLSSNQERS